MANHKIGTPKQAQAIPDCWCAEFQPVSEAALASAVIVIGGISGTYTQLEVALDAIGGDISYTQAVSAAGEIVEDTVCVRICLPGKLETLPAIVTIGESTLPAAWAPVDKNEAADLLADIFDDLKVVKPGGIPGADYDSGFQYINGRPNAAVSWELCRNDNGTLVPVISGANLGEFQAALAAAGYAEWSNNEQHYICPCPPGWSEAGDWAVKVGGEVVVKVDCQPRAELPGAPVNKVIEDMCALRVQVCNKDPALAALLAKFCGVDANIADLLQKQCDANEIASDAAIKDCLLADDLTNCADDAKLAETLDKEAGTLILEGDVVDQYMAGQTIALKDAAGNICGNATVADVEAPAVFEDGKTIIQIVECELAEGKTPVQIETAKPVLTATVNAVVATVKSVSILQAKTLTKAVVKKEVK